MQQTIDTVVELSKLPISIIIVGVGNANFLMMDQLDSDDELLMGSYGRAERDIVQFVPFRKFKNNPAGLAQEVLHEVPNQVTSFYKSKNMAPVKVNMLSNSMITEALGNNKGFTRTGDIKDNSYYINHPKSVATNLLTGLVENTNYPNMK